MGFYPIMIKQINVFPFIASFNGYFLLPFALLQITSKPDKLRGVTFVHVQYIYTIETKNISI